MDSVESYVDGELAKTPADAIVLVDFDETLVFENSTEVYLSTARPLIVAAVVSKLVVKLRLYRLLPGAQKQFVWQEWLRVVLTTVLLPWTLPLWRFVHAPRLARRAANQQLLELLSVRPADRVVVVSHGFRPIIQPVLQHMAPGMHLVASPLFDIPTTRREGKRTVMERVLGVEAVNRAAFVSDGGNDGALLDAVARPIVAQWPSTDVRSAFRNLYLPFLYTERVQPSRRGYLLYGILLYDVPIIALSYAWHLPWPIVGALGLALMHLGLWCIYELGYLENDRFAFEQREVRGKVPSGYETYAPRVHASSAWVYSLMLSAAGLTLLLAAREPGVLDLWRGWAEFGPALALWALFLAAGRLLFGIYNRTKTEFRFLQYPWLHAFRFFGYALIVPLNIIGALLIIAMIFGRWVPYLIYRLASVRWHGALTVLILMAFLLTIPVALAVDATQALSWQTLAAVAWLSFKARKELRTLLAGRSTNSVEVLRPANPPAGSADSSAR